MWSLRLKAATALLLLVGCTLPPPDLTTTSARTLTNPQSGNVYAGADTQAMQADDFANPGMLWVDQGAALWTEGEPSCQSCHDDVDSLEGVATRYPRVDSRGNLINLTQQIERCRTQHQGQSPEAYESATLLALTTLVTHQSKGLAYNVTVDGDAAPFFSAGRDYFYHRRGKMNLACHHCHEVNAGKQLRGETLSQGHGNGYPTYRLQWQTLGSLHRRLRFCNSAIHAQPYPYGAPQYVSLELYLAWRAAELPLESPAVRR